MAHTTPSTSHVAQAQAALEKRRRALLKLADAIRAERGMLREGGEPNWRDQSPERAADALLVHLDEKERTELREVEAALERIGAGAFGLCDGCGKAISARRLRAVPEARLCTACSVRTGPTA